MKTSGVPLSSFSPRVQAQIVAQLHPQKGPAAEGLAKPEGDRLRQKHGPALNKTEAAFLDWLRLSPEGEGREILPQSVTLLIANGCRYTPDFFLPPVWRGKVHGGITPLAYEVKGFMREDAAVKLKVAARTYPWIRFYLVSRKGRAHPWRIQEILP